MSIWLHYLGYLSTGTKESPGNYGFKDQVLVLKWIRDYIGAFGGDKDSVTVSGYSAGSCSLLAHMVSPMSKGIRTLVLQRQKNMLLYKVNNYYR